jgi:hypothetical protein
VQIAERAIPYRLVLSWFCKCLCIMLACVCECVWVRECVCVSVCVNALCVNGSNMYGILLRSNDDYGQRVCMCVVCSMLFVVCVCIKKSVTQCRRVHRRDCEVHIWESAEPTGYITVTLRRSPTRADTRRTSAAHNRHTTNVCCAQQTLDTDPHAASSIVLE